MKNGLGRKILSEPQRGRTLLARAGRLARYAPAFAVLVATLLLLVHHMAAQDDRDLDYLRHRDVDRYNRQLVASDVEPTRDPRVLERRNRFYQDIKRDFKEFGKDDFDDGPGMIRPLVTPSSQIVESAAALAAAQQVFDSFAQEADSLQVALNNDVDYIRGIRSVLPDVIQFSANCQVLADRCRRERRISSLCGDFQAIDLKWQAVSYNLRQLPGLSRTATVQRIDRMDALERQLGDILKIQPQQFDQPELIRRTAALGNELRNLAEDINLELVDPEQRRNLSSIAYRAHSQMRTVCDSIGTGYDPSEILAQFKRYQEMWHPFARQLRTVDTNRSLERTVMRINHANRDISELLRLPSQADTSNLGYMTEALKRDIDDYFTRAPLKLLMELPDSRTALLTAGEFYGNCEQFMQDAGENASQNDLAESFHRVADAWRVFNGTFQPMKSEAARRVLNRIEERVNSIADALQLYDQQFDRRRLSESAYSLLAAAENVSRDTRLWLERDNSIESAQDAISETTRFASHCQRFSNDVGGNVPVEQLRREIVNLYEHYKRIYGYISQCRSRERLRLGEDASRTKNALVDLRTMLEI